MTCPRVARWLLARAETLGAQDALVGDLSEEIAHGRSSYWIGRQLLGVYGCAVVGQLRRRARLSPHLVAIALVALLFGMAAIAPFGTVVETWMSCYLLAGTASLFAHVMSQTVGSRDLLMPVAPEQGGVR